MKKIYRCSLCRADNAQKSTCPMNPYANKVKYSKHFQHGGDRIDKLWQKYKNELIIKLRKDRTAPTDILSLPDNFINADPTKTKYIEWIIVSYINNGISLYEDLMSKVKPALDKYIYLIKKHSIETNPNVPVYDDPSNIMNFCGLNGCDKKIKGKIFQQHGLYDLIDQYDDPKEIDVQSNESDARKIYEDQYITIVQPLTKQGSCKYGKGTKWCTAATVSENMFENYNKQGPLYIIIPKDNPNDKYQIHFETNSVMDSKDKEFSSEQLLQKYPSIRVLSEFREFPILIETGSNTMFLVGDKTWDKLLMSDKSQFYKNMPPYTIYKIINPNKFKYITSQGFFPTGADNFKQVTPNEIYVIVNNNNKDKYLVMIKEIHNRNNAQTSMIMNNDGKIMEFYQLNLAEILNYLENIPNWFENRYNLLQEIENNIKHIQDLYYKFKLPGELPKLPKNILENLHELREYYNIQDVSAIATQEGTDNPKFLNKALLKSENVLNSLNEMLKSK
jgi:hypothetical protein